MSHDSNFISAFPQEFSTATESDFKGMNSGYIIGQKLLLGQCKDLQAREDKLREEIREKERVINELVVSNGIYATSNKIDVVGVILTFLGTAGVGLAFSAPISIGWKWVIAILSLCFSVMGTLLPSIIRRIANRTSNKLRK